jgi:hypothetical protein
MSNSINIKQETWLICLQWGLLSILNQIMKFKTSVNNNELITVEKVNLLRNLQLAVFGIHMLRNLLTILIPCYYSIYLMLLEGRDKS